MIAFYIFLASAFLFMIAMPISEYLEDKTLIKKFKYKSQIPRPTGKKKKKGGKK